LAYFLSAVINKPGKHMKYLLTGILVAALATAVQAQEKDINVQQLTETKNFIFKAEAVSPARGRTRQLTPEYDLVVTPDTVISFLPYFGRAFAAPIDPSAGGIKFTSSKFDYGVKKAKRKGYEISIRPHDVTDIQALYITVFNNGRATLRVNSLNRESISFTGYIENRD
jgi:hypothetical protein